MSIKAIPTTHNGIKMRSKGLIPSLDEAIRIASMNIPLLIKD